jgi:hypothetical protein
MEVKRVLHSLSYFAELRPSRRSSLLRCAPESGKCQLLELFAERGLPAAIRSDNEAAAWQPRPVRPAPFVAAVGTKLVRPLIRLMATLLPAIRLP